MSTRLSALIVFVLLQSVSAAPPERKRLGDLPDPKPEKKEEMLGDPTLPTPAKRNVPVAAPVSTPTVNPVPVVKPKPPAPVEKPVVKEKPKAVPAARVPIPKAPVAPAVTKDVEKSEESYRAALIAAQEGKKDEALRYCELALKWDPDHLQAGRMIKRLKSRL